MDKIWKKTEKIRHRGRQIKTKMEKLSEKQEIGQRKSNFEANKFKLLYTSSTYESDYSN